MENGTDHREMRAHYRAPGVYYEMPGPVRAQSVFRTAVPIFAGFGDSISRSGGSSVEIHRVEHWQQFLHLCKPSPESYLGYAVRGFFENGGEHCFVIPVPSGENRAAKMSDTLLRLFAPGAVLDSCEDIDLVCVPDAMSAPVRKAGAHAVEEIQSAALEHCARMGDRFAILDGPESGRGPDAASEDGGIAQAISQWRSLPPEHGALYFPWVYVKKSLSTRSSTGLGTALPCDRLVQESRYRGSRSADFHIPVLVPPCGHIAGVYSRTDARVGVHKAPANEVIEGMLETGIDLTDAEHGALNEAGVNCLRGSAGRGVRVWGARTLSGQPQWRYVNIRRLFLTLTRWIRQNMQDIVYEGNDPLLWERVAQRLTVHCQDLFSRGALAGDSPAQAFFVKCDAETNTRDSREAGRIITDVGLAPVAPAEFVVVRIIQSASAIAVTGLNV
ncbi:MAG TPA: phage tail sheath subtilisin-like domain-containing protein [Nitrosospira sp.]|nr:phage tail sheath subtilisin-like domain-containing protein [Nitrosospira sp.]